MDKNKNQVVDEQGSNLPEVKTETSAELELKEEAQKRAELLLQLEKFTTNLNKAPNQAKIAKHKQGYLYIPISTIEKDLAKMFFGLVQYEVISSVQVFNEILVTARIKVFHPVIQQWLNYDGVGSAVIQQDANTKVQDFHLAKKSNAMQLAFPRAYAEAIKNASKKIGKKFGSDLNRELEDNYQGFFKEKTEESENESEILNK